MFSLRPPPISIDEALSQLLAHIVALDSFESVPLDQAFGRIAAETVVSTIDLPSTHNAAVDGYGVNSKRLALVPSRPFKVVGVARAGHPFDGRVGKDEAIEIYTGSVMPSGVNCVAMHEHCERNGNQVLVSSKLSKGSNMRPPGENLAKGENAIIKGELITAALIGQLASSGTDTIKVWQKLRVAVLSTGDEVVSVGKSVAKGQIFDANRPMLKAMMCNDNVELVDYGIVPDNLDALAYTYEEAVKTADVVISSGGASDGVEDHTQNAMQKIGAKCVFWRLAMKPGRPMAVGRYGKKLIFCLPGNPVAAFVCTKLLKTVFPG